jgi:hypothetical protein
MMRRFRLFCRVVVVVFAGAFVVLAGSASAAAPLPSLLTLPGETVPVTIESLTNVFATELGVKNASSLEGEGILIKLTWSTATSNLGQAEILLTKVHAPAKPTVLCKTAGDGAGLVLLPSGTEWHLVYTTTNPLVVVLLILIPEFTLECEPFGTGLKIKVKGSNISTITPQNKEVLTTEEFGSNTKCTKATTEPEITQWLNNAEETQIAKLEANSGIKFEKACMNVAGEVKLKPSKMIEVMG